MRSRAQSLALLLLGAGARFTGAQELMVVVESPSFTLNTRLAGNANTTALVVSAESSAFTLDARLSTGFASPALVETEESPAFTLDTRLADDNPSLAVLVVTA